jgi:hypothetical protein
MKKNYYTFEEIKELFKEYRELKESNITEDEYDLFCEELHVLPKEIVDKVHTEIHFVPMSADPKKVNQACYVQLKKLTDEEKEGIIVLTPFIFASFVHESGKVIEPNNIARPRILHEVAHHILGHDEYKDEKDREEKEKAADEQVVKWLVQRASRDKASLD